VYYVTIVKKSALKTCLIKITVKYCRYNNAKESNMTNFTIRISSKQKVHLIRQASTKNTTKANIIRELIEDNINKQNNE